MNTVPCSKFKNRIIKLEEKKSFTKHSTMHNQNEVMDPAHYTSCVGAVMCIQNGHRSCSRPEDMSMKMKMKSSIHIDSKWFIFAPACVWILEISERVAEIVWSLYGPVPQFWLIVSGWRKLIKCGFVCWVYLMSFTSPFLWLVWFVESLAKWSEPLARHRLFLPTRIQTSICESPKFASNDEDEEYMAGRSRKVKMGSTHSVRSSWS